MGAVALYADQIAIMNYDYAGPWSKRTGLVAPLYHAPGDPEIDGDVDSTIGSYKKAGVPVSRMLMGLPSTPIPGIKLRKTIMDCFNSANRIARMLFITT
jgi:GH18 family chitinase